MKLSLLCEKFSLKYEGEDKEITGLQTLENAKEEHIVYLENNKLLENLKNTKAGAAIVYEKFKASVPKTCAVIISSNPHLDMAILSAFFTPKIINSSDKKPIIDKSA
ncbi:MAG: UDP-3-O-(3-hydroxymyristoyl)glucosamine N-acyltransferase, partial [Campylobacteraceae bacterium]|nr:UDP-3-O-(3-hydroxymyristoyl)glucosamine N-acyltransferase [Campylobacteraceae bacterium]